MSVYDEDIDEEDELNAHENINNQNNQDITDSDRQVNDAEQLLDRVNIQVDVVIGEARMSMRELTRLKLSDIIKLGNLDQLVKLQIENQAFAEGILVDIGGVIGVKITNKIKNIAEFEQAE